MDEVNVPIDLWTNRLTEAGFYNEQHKIRKAMIKTRNISTFAFCDSIICTVVPTSKFKKRDHRWCSLAEVLKTRLLVICGAETKRYRRPEVNF